MEDRHQLVRLDATLDEAQHQLRRFVENHCEVVSVFVHEQYICAYIIRPGPPQADVPVDEPEALKPWWRRRRQWL